MAQGREFKRAANKYGVKCNFLMPWIPEAGPEDEENNIFLNRIMKSMEYPPLFTNQSWTKSVPYTDTQQFYKPSETIGSAYSPEVRNLRIQDLPPRRKKPPPNPLGADGKLRYPSKKQKKDLELESKRQNEALRKKKERLSPYSGIVDIEDLLTGEYWRKKAEEKRKREYIRDMKLKQNVMEWDLPDLWAQERV